MCEEEITYIIYATSPLLLAAFFKLSITEGLMLSNMKRPSSPGYKDLRTKQEEKNGEKVLQIQFRIFQCGMIHVCKSLLLPVNSATLHNFLQWTKHILLNNETTH